MSNIKTTERGHVDDLEVYHETLRMLRHDGGNYINIVESYLDLAGFDEEENESFFGSLKDLREELTRTSDLSAFRNTGSDPRNTGEPSTQPQADNVDKEKWQYERRNATGLINAVYEGTLSSLRTSIEETVAEIKQNKQLQDPGQYPEINQEHLSSVINGLESLRRMTDEIDAVLAGEEERSFDLEAIVDDYFDAHGRKAEIEGVSLEKYIPSNVRSIQAPAGFPSIVRNLVGNSLEHAISNEGGADTIKIDASYDQLRDEVTVEYWDNGPGISEDSLHDYLEVGGKGEDSTGSGLGLPLLVSTLERYGAPFEIKPREEVRHLEGFEDEDVGFYMSMTFDAAGDAEGYS